MYTKGTEPLDVDEIYLDHSFVPYFLPRGHNNHPAGCKRPLASTENYAPCPTSVCSGPREPKEGRIGDKIGQNKSDEKALFRGIFHGNFRGNSMDFPRKYSWKISRHSVVFHGSFYGGPWRATGFRGIPWKVP